jgi:large subunit ribosomal protein L22
VADLVRQVPVDVALEQLRFSAKNAALPLSKAINSAVANAVHNFNMTKENLFVKAITIDQGPVFKRYAPRAQGRAFVERKRTSHINVTLESRVRKAKAVQKTRSIFSMRPRPTSEVGHVHADTHATGKVNANTTGPRQAPRSDEKRKQSKVSLKRRMFNRKSGE